MKKITFTVLTLASVCGNAGTMGPADADHWQGFYVGANAGYWWSQTTNLQTVGAPSFVNPLFPLGAGNIANALAAVGTNSVSHNFDGFIGGGQFGYNYQLPHSLLTSIDFAMDGLTNNSSAVSQTTALVNFPNENYVSTLTVNKKIDYLGTVRGRLGFLYSPSLLLYGIGGFAFGDVSLNESFVAVESLGPVAYPTVNSNNSPSQTRPGWTAGGGGEWMFKPQWSAKIEYDYYDLGTVHNITTLTQINNLQTPAVAWGAATVLSSARIAVGTVRVGVTYHFA